MNILAHLHSLVHQLKKLKKNKKTSDFTAIPNRAEATIEVNEAKNKAIQILIGRGKSRADAELIVKAMEEWELDFALAAVMDFKVVGGSVWIDNEE